MNEEQVMAVCAMALVVLWLLRGMWRQYWRNQRALTEEEAYWRGYTYAVDLLQRERGAQEILEAMSAPSGDRLHTSFDEGVIDGIGVWIRAGKPFREQS